MCWLQKFTFLKERNFLAFFLYFYARAGIYMYMGGYYEMKGHFVLWWHFNGNIFVSKLRLKKAQSVKYPPLRGAVRGGLGDV